MLCHYLHGKISTLFCRNVCLDSQSNHNLTKGYNAILFWKAFCQSKEVGGTI